MCIKVAIRGNARLVIHATKQLRHWEEILVGAETMSAPLRPMQIRKDKIDIIAGIHSH